MVELLERQEQVAKTLCFTASQSLRFELVSERTNMAGNTTRTVIHMQGKPASQLELWEVFPQCRDFALVTGDFDKAERTPQSYFCSGRHTLRLI